MQRIYSNPVIGFGLGGLLMVVAFVGTIAVARADDNASTQGASASQPTSSPTAVQGIPGQILWASRC